MSLADPRCRRAARRRVVSGMFGAAFLALSLIFLVHSVVVEKKLEVWWESPNQPEEKWEFHQKTDEYRTLSFNLDLDFDGFFRNVPVGAIKRERELGWSWRFKWDWPDSLAWTLWIVPLLLFPFSMALALTITSLARSCFRIERGQLQGTAWSICAALSAGYTTMAALLSASTIVGGLIIIPGLSESAVAGFGLGAITLLVTGIFAGLLGSSYALCIWIRFLRPRQLIGNALIWVPAFAIGWIVAHGVLWLAIVYVVTRWN